MRPQAPFALAPCHGHGTGIQSQILKKGTDMPTKILFVDDEPKLQLVIRQLFRHEIRDGEFDFAFALNGVEALDHLKADPKTDIVMTDINMPKMNGLTLLAELQSLKSSLNPVLTAIVVSAYGDMGNIRKAMNAGAFDFLVKPIDFQDIKITLAKAVDHVRQIRTVMAQEQRAKAALHKANEELEMRVRARTAELERTNAQLHQEIVDRKSWEEALKKSENRTRSIIENAPIGIYITDESGSFEFVNPAFCKTCRWASSELLGRHFSQIFPEEQREALADLHHQFMAEEAHIRGAEWNVTTRAEEHLTILADAARVTGHDGRPKNVTFITDITHRKQMEQELQMAKETAEMASKAKSEFLANMSHEIRTPMNAIIGMGDLIMGTDMSAKQREYLSIIRSSSKSLLALLNDILDFSKIEAGKLDLETAPFMLDDLLNEVADNFRNMIFQKEIELIMDAEPNVPCALMGDPLRLRQVLVNLLGNAFKFTEKGNICLRIEVREQKADEVVLRFLISDTGIGVPEEKVEGLFDAFNQADTSVSRKYGGTGLGLTISQGLVQMMGGDGITVESEPGKGSVFSFTARLGRLKSGKQAVRTLPEAIQGMNVLVVEDNELTRMMLGKMLESLGLGSRSVGTAEEALDTLRSGDIPFDLVVIDWKLPGMDGLKASEMILGDESLNAPHIILMSAYGRENLISHAERIGISGFLLKPFSYSSLFNIIAEAFGYAPEPKDDFPENENFKGIPILLAEDNKANQLVACEILSKAGFVVDLAENGIQAVAAVQNNAYAAVLMDIQMPGMDGLEATRQIRKWEKAQSSKLKAQREKARSSKPESERDLQLTAYSSQLPIIAMTAHAMKGDRERCLDAGMDDYVSKPIDRAELFRTLRKWVSASGLWSVASGQLGATSNKQETTSDKPLAADRAALPGIDVSDALRRTGISWEIFRKLLQEVCEDQKMVFKEMKKALADADQKELRHLAHSMAGASANISSYPLHKAARSLEYAADEDADALFSILESVERELAQVTETVASIAETGEDQKVDQEKPEPADMADLLASFEKLADCLDNLDPFGSSEIIEPLLRWRLPEDMKKTIQRLNMFVKDFGFEEAAEVLSEIMEKVASSKL